MLPVRCLDGKFKFKNTQMHAPLINLQDIAITIRIPFYWLLAIGDRLLINISLHQLIYPSK
ncbi:MAG: hypothetical protein AB4038_12505 [Prochloraceae cyanobacterium]